MLRKLFAKLTGSQKKKKPAASSKKKAAPKKKTAPKKKAAAKPRKTPAKKKAAPKSKAKPSKKTRKSGSPKPAQKQTPPGIDENQAVGEVVAFFRIPVVAVVKLKGPLKTGDKVWIYGHTTDQKLTINSMQINHKPIPRASKGDEIGIKISSRARLGDRVYLL